MNPSFRVSKKEAEGHILVWILLKRQLKS